MMRIPFVRREEGVAMITAVLIGTATLLLSIVAVSLAVQNSEESGENKRRVQSAGAAEAGIDYVFALLEDADADNVECGPVTQAMGTGEFTATITFLDPSDDEIACSGNSLPEIPARVAIESEGRVGSASRTMQALVTLRPLGGAGFGPYAIFSEGDVEFDQEAKLAGNASNDADLYSNGDVVFDNEGKTLDGSIFAQGNVSLTGEPVVQKDIWAGGTITLAAQSRVVEDVRSAASTTPSIELTGESEVGGDAEGMAVSVCGDCDVAGDVDEDPPHPDPPPVESFPTFSYDASAWQAAGYTDKVYSSCSAAKDFITNMPTGDYVVRITDTCELSLDEETVSVLGNLAIISNGGVAIGGEGKFQPDAGPHDLFFVLGVGSPVGCTDHNFVIGGNAEGKIEAGLPTFIHTPCEVVFDAEGKVHTAQVIAGAVNIASEGKIDFFQPVSVPGFGSSGWAVDVIYVREIQG